MYLYFKRTVDGRIRVERHSVLDDKREFGAFNKLDRNSRHSSTSIEGVDFVDRQYSR
jgi:hypothetical protein